ncbi:MAG: hypothetical protein HXY34_03430 [Candidatus Thorarchaeota archaeon]|nr:hypothetical protein [Candidatus Thorarchaeota archaeon]
MPLSETEKVVEIRDPLHGYVGLTKLESQLLSLRLCQRSRTIRVPAGVFLVYPGAEASLMSHMLGYMHMVTIFLDSLGSEHEDVLRGRLTAMLLTLARGPWSNVMDEYLSTRGHDMRRRAEEVVRRSAATDMLQASEFSLDEIVDCIQKGVPLDGTRVDIHTVPVNPRLVDMLMRDAYFSGVQYAQLEYRRLFNSMRPMKNQIGIERSSLFTLESYISAGANMFEAVYYHRAVRAAELMLLRVLDSAGRLLFRNPGDGPIDFFECDDITFQDHLCRVSEGDPEEMKTASKIYNAFRRRYLLKEASSRAISDPEFIERLSRLDGAYSFEREVAEAVGIEPSLVYVDFPNRDSVSFYPCRLAIDQIVLFERGSRGYETWRFDELSVVARSLKQRTMTIRVYTTRGYRQKVKKEADSILESVDPAGSLV